MMVYLGGPINGCTDEEANGWRDATKLVLAERGHQWRDPLDRDYRGRELEPEMATEIVYGDMDEIRTCDLLLMNAPKPSYGTAMEIFYGWLHAIGVVVVHPEGTLPSPWVVFCASEIRYGSVVDVARSL